MVSFCICIYVCIIGFGVNPSVLLAVFGYEKKLISIPLLSRSLSPVFLFFMDVSIFPAFFWKISELIFFLFYCRYPFPIVLFLFFTFLCIFLETYSSIVVYDRACFHTFGCVCVFSRRDNSVIEEWRRRGGCDGCGCWCWS